LARHPNAVLVGRQRERNRLWRDFEDVLDERSCRLVTLLGPAGVGKTRLVADFLERVGEAADVLRGRCLSYGDGITYWPLVEILVGIDVDPDSIVGASPEETRVAFRRLLEDRARAQIVVVDDLQWAEPTLLDLVEHVADFSRDAPIFLLCVARTELLELRPGWGGGKVNTTSVLLGPLAEDECGELIANRLGGSLLDDGTRDRIVAASEGNPLYVEEMLAMVRERGSPEDVVVPPTIQALLQARLDLLDEDERAVIEHAAIEGQVFHRGSVAVLAPDRLRIALDSHLSSLLRKELIRPERSLLPDEEAFRFRHLLIRDAAYAAMSKALRADLHERFAEWLEGAATESTFDLDELLGYHLERAFRLLVELGRVGKPERDLAARAAARLLAAGRASLRRAHLEEATGLMQRGIGLLSAEDPRRLEALPDLARALLRRGELQQAEDMLREAIAAARATGDERTEARARLAHNSLRTSNDPEASVENELSEALEIAASMEGVGDLPILAQAYRQIGMCRFMLGRASEGEKDLERSARLARRAEDTAAEHAALSARLRLIAYGPLHAVEGIAFCERLLEDETTNVADKMDALQVRALLAAMRGDLDLAYASSSAAATLGEEFGLVLQKGLRAVDIGFAQAISGDLDAAERELRVGYVLLAEVGETGTRATLTAMLADVAFRQGRDEEVVRLAEESRAISGHDDLDAQPRWRAALARTLARRGEHADAERLALEAVALLEATDFVGLQAYVFDVLAEVLQSAGRMDDAVAAVEQAIALHERKGNVVSAARSRSALDELRVARGSITT